jgi:hypothetical protein
LIVGLFRGDTPPGELATLFKAAGLERRELETTGNDK